MKKKEVKGIGFGIGIGADVMIDALMNAVTGKIGKMNDKGIYQNFTAITTWDTNGGVVQLQKFEDGKPVGHVKVLKVIHL